MIRSLVLLSSSLALCACSTVSFAPPKVDVTYAGESGATATCYFGGGNQHRVTVNRNVGGATRLVDIYVDAYRCAGHSAANGRQAFELPAFLATTGAAVAVALGGGANWGIGATGASAAFNAGKSYWDPKAKAAIFDHALDALLCIKTESVGIDHYTLQEVAKEEALDEAALQNNLTAAAKAGGTASVSADEQYFAMVAAAVYSVERVLSQRLSNVGTIDASSVAAEIENAVRAADEAREAKKSPPPDPNGDKAFALLGTEEQKDALQRKMVDLDLAELQPELQKCVTYAKL